MIKHSKQRECILNHLVMRTDHPTAEAVYLSIREEFPKISLATVYRNLSLLAEMGTIQKLSTGSGPDRFDGMPYQHNHFICDQCGEVIDLQMDSISHIDEIAGRDFDGHITGHSIFFHGICPHCMKKPVDGN